MGLVRGVARTAVIAGTATAVSGRVHRRQEARWAAQDQQAYADMPPPAPAAPAMPSSDDTLARLKELAELKAAGVLTDAEFEVQKEKILAGG